jgi:hypothetical protein
LHLEYEERRATTLEQRYVHGKWRIIKIYVKGELREVIVARREEYYS